MFSLTQMRCRRARSAPRYCYFEDGRKATGDVLVAADGTHSMTRSYVLGHAVERRYVGYQLEWLGSPVTIWLPRIAGNIRRRTQTLR